MRPRTKHICIKMHHFREHVRTGKISIQHVPSKLQLADIATKPQPEALFIDQRERIMHWQAEHATEAELAALASIHLEACDETTEVRPTEVRPLDRIDQVHQREVKPSTQGLAKETVCPSLAGPGLQPPAQECQQASVSPKVAMYLTAAEQYLGKFTMTAAKHSATLQSVRNLRKDRPRKAKSMPKSSN
jgi:hypothetical protein